MATSTIVPEPVDYSPPLPLRKVSAVDAPTLIAAIKNAQPGTLIQLEPRDYGDIQISYGTQGEWKGATQDNPLQIVGAPGYASKLGNLGFINASNILVRSLAAQHIGFFNSFGDHVVDCDYQSMAANAIGVTYQLSPNPGGYKFLNNRVQYIGPMTPGVWTPGRDGGGIMFGNGWDIGDNNWIAGNVISGWHDGMQMGTRRNVNPSNNLVIERNFIYDCEDDAIEADGCHVNARISDNVIGGSSVGLTSGISIAPGGPGPILVRGNSISGFFNLPLKWNTDVDNADTQNCEVTQNTIVQTSAANIGWYFAGPINGVKNLNIHGNTFYSRGGVYITEAIRFPGLLDGNRLYSTQEFPYSANAQNPKGCLFRFFDPTTNSNKYYLTFADFQKGTGFEKNGKYAPFRYEPVAIPGFPIEKICRWQIVEPTPPAPPATPARTIKRVTLEYDDGTSEVRP